jgi:segregation and condensation protein A
MGEVLGRLEDGKFYRFEGLFTAEEGKLGVLVTFLAVLELAKELLDIVQEEPLAPIYVKSLAAGNTNARCSSAASSTTTTPPMQTSER